MSKSSLSSTFESERALQQITVDEARQSSWLADVRRFHSEAKLQVRDRKGRWHTLISIDRAGAHCAGFDGPADRFVLTASRPLRRTNWASGLLPVTSLQLRVDTSGQLELWSGDQAIAKILDEQPANNEWTSPLLHVYSPNAQGLRALLASSVAASVKSLDVGEGVVTADLEGLGALAHLESLDLNDDSSLSDLAPIAALRRLKKLRLRFCQDISDIGALGGLNELQSLELGSCGQLRSIEPLRCLTQLRSLHIGGAPISDLEAVSGLLGLASLGLTSSSCLRDLRPLQALQQLQALDLSGCDELSDLSPLAALGQLKTLSLSHCDRVADLSPLQHLDQLAALDLGSCEEVAELGPLSRLMRLQTLDLAGCSRVTDLAPLATLAQLDSLQLGGHDQLGDLQPLRDLVQLKTLDLTQCRNLRDLGPVSSLKGLTSLNLSHCAQVHDLKPLAELSELASLRLRGLVNLKDLRPLAGLSQLTFLSLDGCKGVHDLGPLSGLRQLTTLDLTRCANLGDLGPLASLGQLTTLKITDADHVVDVGPLASLDRLTSLSLAGCHRLRSVGPLRTLLHLEAIDLSACPHLALISGIEELPALTRVVLLESPNVRDVDALSKLPMLRELKSAETAAQDSVLLACATRRRDTDLRRRLQASAASLHLSRSTSLHAQRLIEAVQVLAGLPGDHGSVLREVAGAMRARPEITAKTWQALFAELIRAPEVAACPGFEAALSELPLADVERVLAPALLALAEAPATAKAWALDLAQRALLPVAASATHAREVAPAAAVFFHSQGLATEVDAWLERGSVAQAPAWRDRVLVALLGRALRAGEILEARRLFALVQTPERRDEARGLLVEHLSSRSEFRDAASELDAIVDRAVRASVAASALRQAPAWAAEPDASLSLLLALDGDPDTLAEVLSSMIQQAPDSELVRHLAAVFAPTQGVDLAKQLDVLLAHPSVAERVKPKQLAALRGRIGTDATLVHRTLVHGTAALLEAEDLVDEDERAEITAAILGQPA